MGSGSLFCSLVFWLSRAGRTVNWLLGSTSWGGIDETASGAVLHVSSLCLFTKRIGGVCINWGNRKTATRVTTFADGPREQDAHLHPAVTRQAASCLFFPCLQWLLQKMWMLVFRACDEED